MKSEIGKLVLEIAYKPYDSLTPTESQVSLVKMNYSDGEDVRETFPFFRISGNTILVTGKKVSDDAIYIAAANQLANLGIIVDHSSAPSEYRLTQPLVRFDAISATAKALGGILENETSYMCTGVFMDIGKTRPFYGIVDQLVFHQWDYLQIYLARIMMNSIIM